MELVSEINSKIKNELLKTWLQKQSSEKPATVLFYVLVRKDIIEFIPYFHIIEYFHAYGVSLFCFI